LVLSGRAWGKTRCGAEWILHLVETGQARRIALVAPTAADTRDVMIEGESGILSVAPPWNRPHYEPSKRRLTWPGGAVAMTASADEPERLRGPQFDHAWVDELGSWRRPEAFDNLLFGLRLGSHPRLCVTATPRATGLIRRLVSEPTTALVRGSTYENKANLAPSFFDTIIATYEGTRLGQQEVYAQILEIAEGAWFSRFDVAKHVSETAEYNSWFPVHIGIDAGVSRHTGCVWLQVQPRDAYRHTVTIFADYYAEGKTTEANARAIKEQTAELPCRGRLDFAWIDPASMARSGVGPAAYGEYERVFGRILSRAPHHQVTDALNFMEVILDKGDLLIHPRCLHLRSAFQSYSRARRGGEWLDYPAENQSPSEDLIDSLRYAIRSRFPEGHTAELKLRPYRFQTSG
jgi:hypothetical protein